MTGGKNEGGESWIHVAVEKIEEEKEEEEEEKNEEQMVTDAEAKEKISNGFLLAALSPRDCHTAGQYRKESGRVATKSRRSRSLVMGV